MRIIAGEYKGRALQAPKGATTRPTTDRVREALMSTLVSIQGGLEGEAVLDAFAGSGALGLEALSRGAERAVFYEKDAVALRVLRANIGSLGIPSSRYAVHHADILKNPPRRAERPYSLVFLDPPYATAPTDIGAFLDRTAKAGLLAPGALISYEHGKSSDSAVEEALVSLQWEPVAYKCYGATAISVLRRRP